MAHTRNPEARIPQRRYALGLIVAGSWATGLVVAVVLVVAPFIEAKQSVLTGIVLLAFALGWALLAVPSIRSAINPSAGPRRQQCSSRSPV
jgi:hypothetical protein